MGRLSLLLLVAAGLAPGMWWRSPLPELDEREILLVDSLRVPPGKLGEGLEIAGAWQLRSSNHHFGGYSALLAMGDGTLLAVSDRWQRMRFAPPGAAPRPVRFDYLTTPKQTDKPEHDIEGVTHDPASGDFWGAYEQINFIERYDAGFHPEGRMAPAAMRRWPSNLGPEAIARLSDGRFIVLAEGSPRWFDDTMPALLFPADPVEGAEPVTFHFVPPDGYRPVDMAVMPDGRVLILVRSVRWRLPPRFEGMLVVADPAEIRAGKRWTGREIAHLVPPVPMDNYEGLAIEPAPGGRLVLWLISDDNQSSFQRTLLLKLLWRPNEKARGILRAPR
jgi:hypothetical protein